MTVWQEIEQDYREKAVESIFGHLAPEEHKTYQGFILFCKTDWGRVVPIQSEFDGLGDSPWFYDVLMEYIEKNAKECGKIYRFNGAFKNYEFTGAVKEMELKPKEQK
jgi:hypothetical protein